MRIGGHKRTDRKRMARIKKRVRIRKKVKGTEERPRLAVFKSSQHTYAQLIDDVKGVTMFSVSTLNTKMDGSKKSRDAAKSIGQEIAKKAMEKNIKNVVFDRSGYLYHGRIKALADGARENGLKF